MENTASKARFYGIGAVIYAIVSGMWLVIQWTLGTGQNIVITGIGFVAIVILAIVAICFIIQSPAPVVDKDDKTGMWFGIIFAWEGIGIAVASGILVALGMEIWIPVAVVVIVGLHFFPLGRLLRISIDYVIGAILLIIGIATPLLVAEPANWVSVISFGAALTLFVAGCLRIVAGQNQ